MGSDPGTNFGYDPLTNPTLIQQRQLARKFGEPPNRYPDIPGSGTYDPTLNPSDKRYTNPSGATKQADAARVGADTIEVIRQRIMAQSAPATLALAASWSSLATQLDTIKSAILAAGTTLSDGGAGTGTGWQSPAASAFLARGPGAAMKSLTDWSNAATANATGLGHLATVITNHQTQMQTLWQQYVAAMAAVEAQALKPQSTVVTTGKGGGYVLQKQPTPDSVVAAMRQAAHDHWNAQAQQLEFAMAQGYWDVVISGLNTGSATVYEGPVDAVAPNPNALFGLGGVPGLPPGVPGAAGARPTAPTAPGAPGAPPAAPALGTPPAAPPVPGAPPAPGAPGAPAPAAGTVPAVPAVPGAPGAPGLVPGVVPVPPVLPGAVPGLAGAPGSAPGLGQAPAVPGLGSGGLGGSGTGTPPALPGGLSGRGLTGGVLRGSTAPPQVPGVPGRPGTGGAAGGPGGGTTGAPPQLGGGALRRPGASRTSGPTRTPGLPGTPGSPGSPGAPGLPGAPGGRPGAPGLPGTGGRSRTPGGPALPGLPGAVDSLGTGGPPATPSVLRGPRAPGQAPPVPAPPDGRGTLGRPSGAGTPGSPPAPPGTARPGAGDQSRRTGRGTVPPGTASPPPLTGPAGRTGRGQPVAPEPGQVSGAPLGDEAFAPPVAPSSMPVLGRPVTPTLAEQGPPAPTAVRGTRRPAGAAGQVASRRKSRDDGRARDPQSLLVEDEAAWTVQTPGGAVIDNTPERPAAPAVEPRPTLGATG